MTGIVASVSANVARIYVPPKNAPVDWSPPVGAIIAAAFWPIALLISLEIISRVQWPKGRVWFVTRYGGLTAVAAIAAVISYRHMSGLLRFYGESGVDATIGPLAVDGLMVVSSVALLAIADNVRRSEVPSTASEGLQDTRNGHMPGMSPDGALALPHGLDIAPLIEAIREASRDGDPSGKKVEAALVRHGYTWLGERDGRVGRDILKVLRPPSGNGSKPEPDTEPSDIEDERQPAEATT